MLKPILYADFNNADAEGRLRLNCTETLKELAQEEMQLTPGLQVVLHDEELEADAEIQFSSIENMWVGVIDWQQLRNRHLPDCHVSKSRD